MRRLIFLSLLSFLSVNSYADSQLTDHVHEIDYSHLSDQSVCSWFQVIPIPEDFINEAKKRGLTCNGVKYSNNSTSSFGQASQYIIEDKPIRKNKNTPANATPKAYDPSSWYCNDGYYRNQSKTACIKVPIHGFKVSVSSFRCNPGYKKSKAKPPTCILSDYSISDLESLSNDELIAVAKEKGLNDMLLADEDGILLNREQIISLIANKPYHAYVSNSPNGWTCYSGYYEKNQDCMKLPRNAMSKEKGEGFTCISGYEKSGNNCIKKISIPPNAYASGSSWECNPGFEKQGNSCKEIEDDTIYKAGSGSGFAATEDGHILTNHHVIDGCSEVALFNKGKSYITTVVTQDPNNDLAILKSDFKPTKVYPLTTEVYLSDDIFAAGYPFGKKISSAITINKGIISALMGPGDDISIFQIDADINSGNSGGPIVDTRGNAVGIAVAKLNAERAKEELKLGSTPEGFNFAVNSMMAIGLFRSQGIDLPPQNNNELSVKERNDLFNQGTFYLSCGMTIAQYEKMIKTDKVMFTRDVFFSNFEGN